MASPPDRIGTRHGREARLVADGDVDEASLVALRGRSPGALLIAADGGAGKLLAAGFVPDLVIGDLDSLAPADQRRLGELGVELRVAPRDKDESDLELCLLAAIEVGAKRISVVGALGLVRPEHGIANLLLLADPRLDGIALELVGRGSRISRMGTEHGPGELRLEGSAGDFVSLLPLDAAVTGVSTHGLRFRLDDETLALGPSRGLSNRLTGSTARVSSRRGRLLVVHTDASAESDHATHPQEDDHGRAT